MNIRNISLLGSLFFSGLLTLGACGSSSSSATGGTSGSQGGTPGHAGMTGSFGSTGGAGGHIVAGGGTTGSNGGTTGSTGGAIGPAGGSTGSAGGSSGTCSTTLPSCLQALASCGTPSGTCVQQTTGDLVTTFGFNTCYSNGVKQVSVISTDLSTGAGSISITVSKGGTLCYTETATQTDPNQTNPPLIIKNAAGATVATLMDSADGNSTIVTCTGQAAVTVPNDCMPSGMTTTTDCTDGVCQ